MSRHRPKVFRGIGASPGVAIGKVFLLDRGPVRVPRYHVLTGDIARELERLKTAIEASIFQLEQIQRRFAGDGMEHQGIIAAHIMMLRDATMVSEVEGLIAKELCNAEWAVSRVIERIHGIFDQMTDAYLKERRGDIDFAGERILRNLVGQHSDISELTSLGEANVIVARDLSPIDTAMLSRHTVEAFVTDMGGRTSHTSIIARSLEVPAVVGAKGIFDAAGSGDTIVVDGLDGAVMLRPSRTQLDRGRRRASAYARVMQELLEVKDLPAHTRDGHDIQIAGNIELPVEVTTVVARGGEAIGLYRTEYMFLGRRDIPDEDEHYRTYKQIFDGFGTRPVTVRTLDLGGDKLMGTLHLPTEPNPALGLRGIRLCLDKIEPFRAQIGGLLRAAVHGNLSIMLPMISGVEELLEVKGIIAEIADTLKARGVEHRPDVPIGIMVEVPSAALCADALAEHSAFFSIGTNDLMQYLLAIDRTNERVAYLYRPLHPAVLRCLKYIVDAGARRGLKVSVCGEMAGDSEFTPILLGLGLAQLSMNAASIPRIKRLVREVKAEECRALVQEALAGSMVRDTEIMVRNFVQRHTAFMGPTFSQVG